MEFLNIYLYELKKETKPVALITIESDLIKNVLNKIKSSGFSYLLQPIKNKKANIFFGKSKYIIFLKKFYNKDMSNLDIFEDFLLGIVLGYSLDVQIDRFLNFPLNCNN